MNKDILIAVSNAIMNALTYINAHIYIINYILIRKILTDYPLKNAYEQDFLKCLVKFAYHITFNM